MGRKYEVTSKAVIYTKDGVKVVDARVLKDTDNYVKLGRLADMRTETIDRLRKFTQTKFCQLPFDLMRLAQFEPIHSANVLMNCDWFSDNGLLCGRTIGVDFSVSLPEIDAQLYRKYDSTPAMIKFAEERYSYGNAVHEG